MPSADDQSHQLAGQSQPMLKASPPQTSAAERLAEVTRLHNAGLLTDDEYQAKRAEIIDLL